MNLKWRLAQRLVWLCLGAFGLFCSGCSSQCESYCEDYADTMEALSTLVQPGALDQFSWFDADGNLSRDDYLAECRGAPATQDCEDCAQWHQLTFLEPVDVKGNCAFAFWPEESTPETVARCRAQCSEVNLAGLP